LQISKITLKRMKSWSKTSRECLREAIDKSMSRKSLKSKRTMTNKEETSKRL